MRIVIAGDSAGEPLVKVVLEHLSSVSGIEVTDLSKGESDATEYYAGIAERTSKAILEGRFDRGVLVCGTGIGVCISANKIPGIRAALTHDTYSAERAQLSNNAQIITMGARVIGPELAKSIVNAWLQSNFDVNGRSASNVAAIDALDTRYRKATT
jgi:RpiB/LacA/LacB family sugar-phosphate isomerase